MEGESQHDGFSLLLFDKLEELGEEGGLGLPFQGAAREGEVAANIGNSYAYSFEAVIYSKIFHSVTE
jgi:hypothetical protein